MRQELAHFIYIFGLCCAVGGCATGPRVKVTAEVIDPERARSRSVTVVSDSFMSDAAEADIVAELVRDQLASQGFKIKETEEKAELIVISTIERSAPAETARVPQRCGVRSISQRSGTNQPNGIPKCHAKARL